MEHVPQLLLIDKPKGITSFDVIRHLRREYGVRKMGHAGTLDPRASGLLLVGVGEGTKLLKDLIGLPKTYIAEVLLGVRTDTGDMDGEVIEEKPVPTLAKKEIEKVLASIQGAVPLKVPRYSAIKKDGKPLYWYARKGLPVEVPEKQMVVKRAELLQRKENVLRIEWEVGSGTYIRSLAEELGRRLGTVATLTDLRRTQVGEYGVNDARPFSALNTKYGKSEDTKE